MKVSTTTSLLLSDITMDEDRYRDIFDALISAGFDWLDYNLGDSVCQQMAYGDPLLHQKEWRRWYEGVRTYCAQKGTGFNQTHNLVHNYFADTLETAELNGIMDRAIEATRLLGADITVMHPIAPPGREGDTRACLRANKEFFQRKGEIASKFGVTIAVENMLSTRLFDGTIVKRYCDDIEELCALVDAINMPNVKICLDTGHLHYMGAPVYSSIMRVQKNLIALHIHDNSRFNDAHITPYSGSFDWEELYRALTAARYQGYFTLEILHACKKLPPTLQHTALLQIHALARWMASRIPGKETIDDGEA